MKFLLKAANFRPVVLLAVLSLGGTLAYLLYITAYISELKNNLPLEILNRQRGLQLVLEDMFGLHSAVMHSATASGVSDLVEVREQVALVRQRLAEMLQFKGYAGDEDGASTPLAVAEINALVNPVLDDLDLWSREGVMGLAPESPAVQLLMARRVDEVPALLGNLLSKAHEDASTILRSEVSRLEVFRLTLLPIMLLVLLVGGLFAIVALRASRSAAATRVAEQRLRDAIESIPMAFVLFDDQGRLVMGNERHRATYPGDPNLVREGTDIRDLVTSSAHSGKIADAVDDPEAWIERRLAAFHDPSNTIEIVLTDGRHLEVNEQRTRDGGTVSIATNVTRTRAREADLLRVGGELREKNQLLDVAMENMVVGLAMFDSQNRLIICNRRYLDMYRLPAYLGQQGTPLAEIIEVSGKIEGLSVEDTRRSVALRLEMASSRSQKEDLERLSSGQVIKRIHRPLPDGGSVTVYEDVTARAIAERALRAAKEEAEMANRSKSEFLANVSHELRTPLNAIIGFSEIIKVELFGPVTPSQYRVYAGDIYDSGRHLLSLINDILDLSKIEAGKYEMAESEVDLVQTVEVCLRLVRERAMSGRVRIVNAMPSKLPPLVADSRALKQIMLNLLSNAVKFTPGGGTITISAMICPDGALELTVMDTGIGMSPEEIDIAMSQFGQVDSAFSRRFDGTGLGLPLTQRLVEMHGGTIELDSEKDVGTSVTARFPAERVVRTQSLIGQPGAL